MSKPANLPARIRLIEIDPPPAADLRRAIECAQGILSEYEDCRPTVVFTLGALRVTVQSEGGAL